MFEILLFGDVLEIYYIVDSNLPVGDVALEIYDTVDPSLPLGDALPLGNVLEMQVLSCRLWYVVRDLCKAHPTQEICLSIVYHAQYATPTGQHELDHTDHTDQEYICRERSIYHELWESIIDNLPM